MKTITVNVTQEHIDRGSPGLFFHCPIALAMLESGLLNPKVGPTWASFGVIDKDGFEVEVTLPKAAQKFIRTYDWTPNPQFIKAYGWTLNAQDMIRVSPFSFCLSYDDCPE